MITGFGKGQTMIYYNAFRTYKKEDRYEMEYEGRNGERAHCYPRSKEQLEENKRVLKENGRKLYKVTKLYPFSTNKNQHNFDLIHNVARNTMTDMDNGKIPYNWKEYERLDELADKAEKYFCYPLPVAWVSWEELQEMKELAALAVEHRSNACVEAGHPELVRYC